jgi:hypothetical protein
MDKPGVDECIRGPDPLMTLILAAWTMRRGPRPEVEGRSTEKAPDLLFRPINDPKPADQETESADATGNGNGSVAREDGPQTGQGEGAAGLRCTPSSNAACCQGLGAGGRSAVGGAVSRMNLSRAATTAAVSSGEAVVAIN